MKNLLLINHPTITFALKDQDEAKDVFRLGNAYKYTMPVSLARVACIIEDNLKVSVTIFDLKASEYASESPYKQVEFGHKTALISRLGLNLSVLNTSLDNVDSIGLSNHFTYESGVVRDIIQHCRQYKPSLKILVGGADVKVRPRFYLDAGADIAFVGDLDPEVLRDNDWSQKSIAPAYRYPFKGLIKPAFEKFGNLEIYTDSHDGPVPQNVTTPVGFAYFTRGCPRECDFCESRLTKFENLPIEDAFEMLEHYKINGISTINFSDDNLLLLKRPYLEALFSRMRAMGFAWEFPNGLEVGRFIPKGKLDIELIELLFSNHIDPITGNYVGAYRAFIPVETFDNRDNYKKLRPTNEQNLVIEKIVSHEIPEINFGVVLAPNATEQTFEGIEQGYSEIRDVLKNFPKTKCRFSIFHLIPIALFRTMSTLYTSEEFPEGWNFYFPIYDGQNFSSMELFERRVETVMRIDPAAHQTMTTGIYNYA